MTITKTEDTNLATYDTPVGTIVILKDGYGKNAKPGAIAKVVAGPDRKYLYIEWLKGHGTQMNGGYYPEGFEICNLQIGSRVRVTNAINKSELGGEGEIIAFAPDNGDDVDVRLGSGLVLSYNFHSLTLIEDDDDLDEWEKELLADMGGVAEDAPVATEADAYKVGDIVVITETRFGGDEWVGLRFPVEAVGRTGSGGDPYLKDGVIDERPDRHKGDFYWPQAQLRPFDPATDFKAGDIVKHVNIGDEGVVLEANYTGDQGGDILIHWTTQVLAGQTISSLTKNLKLIGHKEPEPQPEITNWTYEAGQEFDSVEVLDDLPSGSVVYLVDLDHLPSMKGSDGNWYYGRGTHDWTLRQLVSNNITAVIAHVPS